MMRIGHGYDVHAFQDGGRLVLGGVEIPYHRSLKAHSDGDVVAHALMDALLGAAALPDIGRQFPDSDPAYRGADSLVLLRRVTEIIRQEGYSLCNADITVIAQRPKLAMYIDAMRENLADAMDVSVGDVNVKATTEEYLGFTGREEGIAVHSVVLLLS